MSSAQFSSCAPPSSLLSHGVNPKNGFPARSRSDFDGLSQYERRRRRVPPSNADCKKSLALSTVRDPPGRSSPGTEQIPSGGRLLPALQTQPRCTVSARSMLLPGGVNIASLIIDGILPLTVASVFLLYLVLDYRAHRRRIKRTQREIEALHQQAAAIAQQLRRRAASADNARDRDGGWAL